MHKNILKDIKRIELSIRHKQEMLERLRNLAQYRVSHIDEIGGGRGTSDREKLLVKIVSVDEELNSEIDRLIDLKLDMMHRLEKLSPAESDILYQRYFLNLKWREIAEQNSKSLDYCYKLHRQALKNFLKIM